MSKRMRWSVLGLPVRLAMLAVMAGIWLSFPGVALAGSNTWTTSGPYGGGASSLAISPTYATDHTLFASNDGSGLFKSTSGGASWNAMDTGLTSLGVTSLALSPAYATDHTLFAGTDDDVVFKSTTGGASWTAVDSGLGGDSISSLAVSPAYATDHTLFAGTDDGRLQVHLRGSELERGEHRPYEPQR